MNPGVRTQVVRKTKIIKKFIILFFVLTFVLFQTALAQLEIVSNNNVRIGNPVTTQARLTIDDQLSEPDNSNLLIGDWWDEDEGAISIGVHNDYSWIQGWHNKPLVIDRICSGVVFCNQFTWGEVGIGYDIWQPSAKLQVNGNIYATGTITSSDERLKKDIKKLSPDKNKFTSFEAKSYKMDWENEKVKVDEEGLEKMSKMEKAFYEREHYGFLAQDVQKVYPELVYEDNEGFLAIDYQGFIPILFEVIKEQDEKLEAIEKRLEQLEKGNK